MLPFTPQRRIQAFRNKYTRHANGCWIWFGAVSGTYGVFWDGERMMQAHHFSWNLAGKGIIPLGKMLCHNCPTGDNRLCVNPAHLFVGTRKQNSEDMVAKGRSAKGDRSPRRLHPDCYPKGEKCSWAKLTNAQVAEIKSLLADNSPPRLDRSFVALGRKYGVDERVIGGIARGLKWKHI